MERLCSRKTEKRAGECRQTGGQCHWFEKVKGKFFCHNGTLIGTCFVCGPGPSPGGGESKEEFPKDKYFWGTRVHPGKNKLKNSAVLFKEVETRPHWGSGGFRLWASARGNRKT